PRVRATRVLEVLSPFDGRCSFSSRECHGTAESSSRQAGLRSVACPWACFLRNRKQKETGDLPLQWLWFSTWRRQPARVEHGGRGKRERREPDLWRLPQGGPVHRARLRDPGVRAGHGQAVSADPRRGLPRLQRLAAAMSVTGTRSWLRNTA